MKFAFYLSFLVLLFLGERPAYSHPFDDFFKGRIERLRVDPDIYAIPWASPLSQTLQIFINLKKTGSEKINLTNAEGFALLRFVGAELPRFYRERPTLSQRIRVYFELSALVPDWDTGDDDPWFTLDYFLQRLRQSILAEITNLRHTMAEDSIETLAEAEECMRLTGKNHSDIYDFVLNRAANIINVQPSLRYRIFWNGSRTGRFISWVLGKNCSIGMVNFAQRVNRWVEVNGANRHRK